MHEKLYAVFWRNAVVVGALGAVNKQKDEPDDGADHREQLMSSHQAGQTGNEAAL